MMKLVMRSVAYAAVATLAATAAQAQKLENNYRNWNVYSVTQDGKKTCYISSMPVDKTATVDKRGESYFLVTSRGAQTDEVSFSGGYPFKEKSEALVTVDGKAFKLFTKDELAWAYTEKQDAEVVSAMKKGKKLSAKGEGASGGSEDSYALTGFSDAYKRMKALCK